MRPTHVMVASRIDCKTCNGTGIVQHSFKIGPKGPVCPDCNGAKLEQHLMLLEDFAKLFTWGVLQVRGPSRADWRDDHEIRVRPMVEGGTSDGA